MPIVNATQPSVPIVDVRQYPTFFWHQNARKPARVDRADFTPPSCGTAQRARHEAPDCHGDRSLYRFERFGHGCRSSRHRDITAVNVKESARDAICWIGRHEDAQVVADHGHLGAGSNRLISGVSQHFLRCIFSHVCILVDPPLRATGRLTPRGQAPTSASKLQRYLHEFAHGEPRSHSASPLRRLP